LPLKGLSIATQGAFCAQKYEDLRHGFSKFTIQFIIKVKVQLLIFCINFTQNAPMLATYMLISAGDNYVFHHPCRFVWPKASS
jgi:hypothetical protein